VETEVY